MIWDVSCPLMQNPLIGLYSNQVLWSFPPADPVSFLHVHNFNHSPEEFSFEAMLAELGIGQPPTG